MDSWILQALLLAGLVIHRSNAGVTSGDGEGYRGEDMENYNNMAGQVIHTSNATNTSGNYVEVSGDGETEHSGLSHVEATNVTTTSIINLTSILDVTTASSITNHTSIRDVTTTPSISNHTSIRDVTTAPSITNHTSIRDVTTAPSITNHTSIRDVTTAPSITNHTSIRDVTTAPSITNHTSIRDVTTAPSITNHTSIRDVTTASSITNHTSIRDVTTASSITNLTSILTTSLEATPSKHTLTPNLSLQGKSHIGRLLLALGIMLLLLLLCTVLLVSSGTFACQVRNLRDRLCSFWPAQPPRVNADVIWFRKVTEVMETEMEKMMEEAENKVEKTLCVEADAQETEAAGVVPTAPPADPSSDCVLNV
ncbi:mucin-5AC-like [Brienomyrus brachyistius]|uniref:mucin-5AC-like n=1 Tax=Brienomyrus brachyistius TaxID=42636 RepID=UPI0020B3B7B5|nr:mucin-5AC-like [Brienomyrus brachyistius]